MRNNWQKESVFISLLGAFLLLPFAQAKLVFFGVPLYLPEIAILIALWFYFLRLFYPSAHSKGIRKFPLDTIFMTGVLLFFLGAVVSFLSLLLTSFSMKPRIPKNATSFSLLGS